VVTAEMHRLDHNADSAFEAVNALFAEVMAAVERRREEVMAEVERKKEEKRRVLEEQLKIIHTEKAQVDKDVEVGHCDI
jgi:DNA-binding PucR family transcriptional regulator